jgi:starch synthase
MYHLPQRKNAFVIGLVGRIDEQKGIDLLIKIISPLLKNLDIQFVSVGTGTKEYRLYFKKLQDMFPKQASPYLFFDIGRPKRIFAGADAILMPSRFEPSGLVQMESMRYGCVPIARKTGGLADTVIDDAPGSPGNGFLFQEFDHMAFMIAVVRAYAAFQDKRRWKGIVRRGMREDFSWDISAARHAQVYRKALRLHEQHHE